MITTIDGTSTIGATEYDFAQAANYSSSVVMASKVWLQATFDLSALAAGDSFQLAFYDKANGGTHTIVHRASPTGAQSELFEIGPRLTCGAWGVTARKISGTDRSIKCTISIADFDVNLTKWLGNTPASLSANGFVQAMIRRWLTDDAAGTPAALSTSGYLQSMLRRWLTDDAAGTPNVLTAAKDLPVWSTILENGHSAGNIMRGLIRGMWGKLSGVAANAPAWRDLADSKTIATGATTTDGRTSITGIDFT